MLKIELAAGIPVEQTRPLHIVPDNYHRILSTFQEARVLEEGVSSVNEHVYTSGVLPNFAFVGLCESSYGFRMFRSEHSRTHSGVYIPRRLPPEIYEELQTGGVTSIIMGGGLVRADSADIQQLLTGVPVTWLQHPNDDYWGHMVMGFDPDTRSLHYGYTRDRTL